MPDATDWWRAPPLDASDQRLADAFQTIGRPIEDLPYTNDFEKLRQLVGFADTPEARHLLYKSLLRLRVMGRLPGLGVGYGHGSSSNSGSSSSSW